MDQFLHTIQTQAPDIQIKTHFPLHKITAFKAGGAARIFASIDSLGALIKAITLAWEHNIQVRVIGSGTNILVSEEGFDGLVIKNNCRRFELQGIKGKFTNNQVKLSQAFLYAESGAITNQVVRFVIDQNFGGIEYALGLPGTIGGAVAVNANFPKEDIRIERAVFAAKILTKDGIIDVDNNYFRFGFDTSTILGGNAILLSVLFALYPEEKKKLWEKAEAAVLYRTGTQPKNQMTGMTFRNITLTIVYPNSSLPKDVGCEMLLEKAGLLGYRVGGVELYKGNPRYLLNKGDGTKADVEKLLSHIKETIFRQFGVQLEMHLHSIS